MFVDVSEIVQVHIVAVILHAEHMYKVQCNDVVWTSECNVTVEYV